MAEAFAKHYAGDKVIASSAGVEESTIHPLTIEVMKEVGIAFWHTECPVGYPRSNAKARRK
jgi:protein-tyrosine-phosphatase